jgi:RNA polymerase sigma factor (sigma-70 family)
VTVYRRANDVRDPSCFRGWLFRVAKNALLQHVRKYRGEFESLDKDDWFSHGSDQRHFTFKPQEESALYDWMEALEPDEREICILRYVDDLEYQTIADALQIPIGTVKWKLHRIKNKIAIRLGYSGPGLKS